jgi:hypothetical protein
MIRRILTIATLALIAAVVPAKSADPSWRG